jgi:hypothetical protein
MRTYQFSIDCPLPAKRVFEALTDFSEQRVRYFPNLSREMYQVLEQGADTALVVEGTGPIRTTERYHWTDGRIWSVVVKSTVLAEGSMTDIRITPRGQMSCKVAGVVERQYIGIMGRLLATLLVINGRSWFFRRSYIKTLKNVQRAGRKKSTGRHQH